MARWKAWVAAKVQTPGGYHFNAAVKMVPTGEAQGGQVIRFPVERRR
jgi:hypothetical protein